MRLEGASFELALPQLQLQDVRCYLAQRFADDALAEHFAAVLHQRTRGNPLIMVQLADVLAEARPGGAADAVATLVRSCPRRRPRASSSGSIV